MKVQIEISNDTLQTIMDGKRVEGALRLMPSDGKKKPVISFNAYNRKPYKRPKEHVLR